jgi:hypothetical protein
MGLRDQIRRLKELADEDTITLVADDGEEMKVPGDAGFRTNAALWKMGRGEDPEDPLAERLVREGYRGWREKNPDADGTLFTLAARLRESRRRVEEEEKASDGA